MTFMKTKQFKAESKRLLDLMINSIYTHREIFLRELISNASDAMDKLYYKALTEHLSDISREDLGIQLTLDKEARTLTISDNGIGMTKEELENNLGVIAKSGSFAFKKDAEAKEDVDIIGQFGVGFYSAFMVSDCVTVDSRAYGAQEAWRWQSKGAEGYTCCISSPPPRRRTTTNSWNPIVSRALSKSTAIISAIPSGWRWRRAVPKRTTTRNSKPTRKTRPSTAWSPSGGGTKARSRRRTTTSFTRRSSSTSRIPPG